MLGRTGRRLGAVSLLAAVIYVAAQLCLYLVAAPGCPHRPLPCPDGSMAIPEGGYTEDYARELPESDRTELEQLRARFTEQAEVVRSLAAQGGHVPLSTVYITQYDPSTYFDDFRRYEDQSIDYKVGRAMFETSTIPDQWLAPLKAMDEVWVPSHWGRQVFVKAGVAAHKVHVVPEAVNTDFYDPKLGKKREDILPGCKSSYAFLSVFKWEERKNWEVLVQAFVTAFKATDGVTLYLRSGRDKDKPEHDIAALIKDLKVENPPDDSAAYRDMYASADAFVLPTHAEGFGRPIIEAMSMGLPAIATAWSGQMEFMRDDNSFLLKTSGMERAYPNEPQLTGWDFAGRHQWASVDPLDLAKLMRYVRQHPHVAKRTGRRARETVAQKFSREAVARRVVDQLTRIQMTLVSQANAAARA